MISAKSNEPFFISERGYAMRKTFSNLSNNQYYLGCSKSSKCKAAESRAVEAYDVNTLMPVEIRERCSWTFSTASQERK